MRVLKKFVVFLVGSILCFVLLLAGAARFSPSVMEKIFMLGLASGQPWLQSSCAEQLRDYPSKNTVLALIAFVNWTQPRPSERFLELKQEAEEKKKAISPDSFSLNPDELASLKEKTKREAEVNDHMASEAFISLCFLTGRSFGSYFKEEKYGHSWGTLGENDWKKVAGEMNAWALKTFGEGLPSS